MSDGRGRAPGRVLQVDEVREGAEVFVVNGQHPPWTGTVHAFSIDQACVVEDLGETAAYRWVPRRWLRTVEPEAVPVLAGQRARDRLMAGGRTAVRIPGWSALEGDRPAAGDEATVLGVRCTVVSWDGETVIVDPQETAVVTLADLAPLQVDPKDLESPPSTLTRIRDLIASNLAAGYAAESAEVDRKLLYGEGKPQTLVGILGVPGVSRIDPEDETRAREHVAQVEADLRAAREAEENQPWRTNGFVITLTRDQMIAHGLVQPTEAEAVARAATIARWVRQAHHRGRRDARARRPARVAAARRRGTGPCRRPGAPCGCDHSCDD